MTTQDRSTLGDSNEAGDSSEETEAHSTESASGAESERNPDEVAAETDLLAGDDPEPFQGHGPLP